MQIWHAILILVTYKFTKIFDYIDLASGLKKHFSANDNTDPTHLLLAIMVYGNNLVNNLVLWQ